MKRRQVLAGGSALLILTAGCSSQQPSDGGSDPSPGGGDEPSPTIACPSATPTPPNSLSIPFRIRNESEQSHDVTVTVQRGQSRESVFSWSFTIGPQKVRSVVKEVFEDSEVPAESGTETVLQAETHQDHSTTTTIFAGIKRWRTLADQGIGLVIADDDLTFRFRHFGDDGFVPERCG
jgi:hypothetical protein